MFISCLDYVGSGPNLWYYCTYTLFYLIPKGGNKPRTPPPPHQLGYLTCPLNASHPHAIPTIPLVPPPPIPPFHFPPPAPTYVDLLLLTWGQSHDNFIFFATWANSIKRKVIFLFETSTYYELPVVDLHGFISLWTFLSSMTRATGLLLHI